MNIFPPGSIPEPVADETKPWFVCERRGDTAHVKLWGEIGFRPPPVQELLRQIGNSQNVEIEINVTGGESSAAITLFEAIRGRCTKVTIVEYCLSAGIFIACASKHVRIEASAKMAVHLGMAKVAGDAVAVARQALILADQNGQLRQIISSRTGRNAAKFLDGQTHWLNSEQAVKEGLADEIFTAYKPA